MGLRTSVRPCYLAALQLNPYTVPGTDVLYGCVTKRRSSTTKRVTPPLAGHHARRHQAEEGRGEAARERGSVSQRRRAGRREHLPDRPVSRTDPPGECFFTPLARLRSRRASPPDAL